MNSIAIDEASFWEWMCPEGSVETDESIGFLPASNKGYAHLLSAMMNRESITLNRSVAGSPKGARTLDSLSRHIPRKYLLELQFCLAAYSSVFATLFPSMLSHVDNLSYIEWLLYMEPDNESYRDHLVHMFRVAFVCQRFMQLQAVHQRCMEYQFSSTHFLEWCQKRLDTDPCRWDDSRKCRVLYASIYLSSIFHDVGYGYYFLTAYRRRLAGVLPALAQAEATKDLNHKDIARIRNSLAAQFASKYHYAFQGNKPIPQREITNQDVLLSGFFRDNLELNHSVASAIFLIDLADNLFDQRAISDDLYIAFQLAAEAAMLHDMTEDRKCLYFSKNNQNNFLDSRKQKDVPIAALLCFADSMELDGRQRIQRIVEDNQCIFSMADGTAKGAGIVFDESKQCLIMNPGDLISKKDQKDFFFNAGQQCLILFDIPVR